VRVRESTSPSDAAGEFASAAAPFFIVGNDRSGTTMLRVILDRADGIAIPTESMLLGDFARVRRHGDLSTAAALDAFVQRVWKHPKVALWGIEGNPPAAPSGLDHASAYRWAVEQPYRAFALRDGAARWGDKTPYYLDWIDELKAVWPDARIIELVRDGRDVALSIMPLPFGGNNVHVAASDWARGIRLGRAAAERYVGDVLTVRYEDLTGNPGAEVQRVCTFLDIPYEERMLAIEESPSDKVVADQQAWFTNLWNGINQGSVGKWRTRMSARDLEIFAAAAGDELEQHGYELGVAQRASFGPLHRAWWVTANFARRWVNLVKLRIVQERGRELRYVVGRKLGRS
jgi:hypothetical protein